MNRQKIKVHEASTSKGTKGHQTCCVNVSTFTWKLKLRANKPVEGKLILRVLDYSLARVATTKQ